MFMQSFGALGSAMIGENADAQAALGFPGQKHRNTQRPRRSTVAEGTCRAGFICWEVLMVDKYSVFETKPQGPKVPQDEILAWSLHLTPSLSRYLYTITHMYAFYMRRCMHVSTYICTYTHMYMQLLFILYSLFNHMGNHISGVG